MTLKLGPTGLNKTDTAHAQHLDLTHIAIQSLLLLGMYSSHVCKSCHARLWRHWRISRVTIATRKLHSTLPPLSNSHDRWPLADDTVQQASNTTDSQGYSDDIFENYMKYHNGRGRYSRFSAPVLAVEEEPDSERQDLRNSDPERIRKPLHRSNQQADRPILEHIDDAPVILHAKPHDKVSKSPANGNRREIAGVVPLKNGLAGKHIVKPLQPPTWKRPALGVGYEAQEVAHMPTEQAEPKEMRYGSLLRSTKDPQVSYDQTHHPVFERSEVQNDNVDNSEYKKPYGNASQRSERDNITQSTSNTQARSRHGDLLSRDEMTNIVPARPPVITHTSGDTQRPAARPKVTASSVHGRDNRDVGPIAIFSNLPVAQIARRWAYFNENFTSRDCPAFKTPTYNDMKHLAKMSPFAYLLIDITKAWCSGKRAGVPRPVDALERMLTIGVFDGDRIWSELLDQTTKHLLQISCSDKPKDSASLLAVVDLWKAFCFHHRSSDSSPAPAPNDWAFLPPRQPNITLRAPKFSQLMKQSLPLVVMGYHSFEKLCGAALLTNCLLIHEQSTFNISETQRAEYWPFVKFISSMICDSYTHHMWAQLEMSSTVLQQNRLAVEKWQPRIRNIKQDAHFVVAEYTNYVTRRQPKKFITSHVSDGASQVEMISARLESRIGRAMEAQDLPHVQKLWSRVQAELDNTTGQSNTTIPVDTIVQFLKAFMKLKDMSNTIRVWNTMQKQGTKPTEWVWQAVLSGCNDLRDPEALDIFWQKMLDSGFQPTSRIWVTRIHSIMMLRDVSDGLQLIQDIGNSWTASCERLKAYEAQRQRSKPTKNLGPPPTLTVRPNIEMINAALKAISDKNRSWELVERLLEWAKAFGLEVTAWTYNPMIRMAFRKGDAVKGYELIDEMQSKGIEPDQATYALLVNAMFRVSLFEDSQPEVFVQKNIEDLLDDLKEKKALNKYTFTALVDGLIRHNQMRAVEIVLRVLVKSEQWIPATIFTALARHYFDQEHPDIFKLDALWNRANSRYAYIDNIFMDRMIEGWARLDEIGKMREVLSRMVRTGQQPGWRALHNMINAHARQGDYSAVAQIVHDVDNKLTPPTSHREDRQFQNQFWHFVSKLQEAKLLDVSDVLATQRRHWNSQTTNPHFDSMSSSDGSSENTPVDALTAVVSNA
ncbi:hypothetical protein EJ05DRAFT_517263 [Pseudovirgaria hyperparasitica]|uniref:Pentacotripeptide-repeat region of PRORP domain-containing protein n=1 Tax=Pseudovirgaria hyperparasitica TaxID=470096 RepID=A0A6A6W2W8_9PEZI|nr:uncharacterized protein EJ05DRAFT_517263 [Pseudovirgaria hyperparasitica]KAF2756905.1 hypothetical protein EJ05DRAFT_517263 [Pseudovirgaria hyperparasitica]